MLRTSCVTHAAGNDQDGSVRLAGAVNSPSLILSIKAKKICIALTLHACKELSTVASFKHAKLLYCFE
jgi:hypothetical protein